MDWTSAPIIEDAPLEPAHRRFLPAWISAIFARVEAFLERERAQLPLWLVVMFGAGIGGWLWLPGPSGWAALIVVALGIGLVGLAGGQSRTSRALLLGGMALAAGCALIWWRSELVAAPQLERPMVTSFQAQVKRVESRAAKG